MAKSRTRPPPVTGGVRARRNTAPAMTSVSGDASVIKYSCNMAALNSDTTGSATRGRFYVGGYTLNLSQTIGPDVVNNYSTCVFRPGTKIRWEPSCSFNTSGRVICAFTDNPEVMQTWASITDNALRINFIQAFGNTRSFPIWQETDIPFPTMTRRKRFSTDRNPDTLSTNDMERSCQVLFMHGVVGAPPTQNDLGRIWCHDVVHVEGIKPPLTT